MAKLTLPSGETVDVSQEQLFAMTRPKPTQVAQPSPELVEFEANLSEQPQELQDAYNQGGIDAYNEAVEEYNAQKLAEFEEKLKDQPQELQDAYEEGGIEAYNKALEEYNKEIERLNYESWEAYEAAVAARQAEIEAQKARAEEFEITPEEQAQIDEYNSTLAFAEKVRSGEVQLEEWEIEGFWESVKNIEQKLALLQEAIEARKSYYVYDVEIPDDVQKQLDTIEKLTVGKLAPFYDVKTGNINIKGAIIGGVSEEDLLTIGISQETIDIAKAQKELLSKYMNDPIKAIEGGDIDLVRKVYGDEQTLDLQIAVAESRSGAGYDDWAKELNYFLKDVYKEAGGGQVGIDAVVKAQQDALNILDKYKTDEGYNLQLAHNDGITQKTMMLAGFSTEQIAQSLNISTPSLLSQAAQQPLPKLTIDDKGNLITPPPLPIIGQVLAKRERDIIESQEYPIGYSGYSEIYPIDSNGNKLPITSSEMPNKYVVEFEIGTQKYKREFYSWEDARNFDKKALEAQYSGIEKLISKATGTPLEQLDVSPQGIMNALAKPEVQLALFAVPYVEAPQSVIAFWSRIPKTLQVATGLGIAEYSGIETAKYWEYLTPTQRIQGIAFTVIPLAASLMTIATPSERALIVKELKNIRATIKEIAINESGYLRFNEATVARRLTNELAPEEIVVLDNLITKSLSAGRLTKLEVNKLNDLLVRGVGQYLDTLSAQDLATIRAMASGEYIASSDVLQRQKIVERPVSKKELMDLPAEAKQFKNLTIEEMRRIYIEVDANDALFIERAGKLNVQRQALMDKLFKQIDKLTKLASNISTEKPSIKKIPMEYTYDIKSNMAYFDRLIEKARLEKRIAGDKAKELREFIRKIGMAQPTEEDKSSLNLERANWAFRVRNKNPKEIADSIKMRSDKEIIERLKYLDANISSAVKEILNIKEEVIEEPKFEFEYQYQNYVKNLEAQQQELQQKLDNLTASGVTVRGQIEQLQQEINQEELETEKQILLKEQEELETQLLLIQQTQAELKEQLQELVEVISETKTNVEELIKVVTDTDLIEATDIDVIVEEQQAEEIDKIVPPKINQPDIAEPTPIETSPPIMEEPYEPNEWQRKPPKRKPSFPPIEFNEDESVYKKLEHGFITWRQGKSYWAIPQLEDGTFNSDDKIPSGLPFRGSTKYATGEGSVYETMEYIGNNPPEKAFVDLGWAQYYISKTTDGIKLDKVSPDETANWEGVNRYTTPEALARKEAEEREERITRLVEKYKKQYMKPRKKKKELVKKDELMEEVDAMLSERQKEAERANRHTYFGYDILPPQIGGNL